MERIYLSVLYLSGWHFLACLPREYHYIADLKTWTEARAYCRKTYTDLATIENSEDLTQFTATAASESWIGLYNNIIWEWSDGYTGTGEGYKNWQNRNDNEPDFVDYDQFCVLMGPAGGFWDDGCTLTYPFICYRGTQLNPEFVAVTDRMTWFDAQRHCRENYIDLATVRNNTENQEVKNAMQGEDWAWIGLYRDPHMYWSDGSGYSFSQWSSGSIQIGSIGVMCATALQTSGAWKGRPCEVRFPFVCYSVPPPPPVMRQIIKLRIAPGDPSVDLNDAAVKANLLKQFQDSLKEKGVQGVTLKWREQSDGKVFHKEEKSSRKKSGKKTEL
ncbi:macrophage mannose receptor 1-like [Plectropomus leopardus]|uniref:macrophage mannose receptor 1-like n=1 Tax=Plectropomus leopardus TaxID=160734 RepID=UPI001C4B1964|nr:macrophage mannose receptor 1-like [Plectropomus leopardus]